MKSRKSVLIAVFILIAGSMVYGAIPATERAALIALYNSTGGDSWTNNSGWKEGTLEADGFGPIGSEEHWFGVSISSGGTINPEGNVGAVDLSGNNLSGTIPAELGSLLNLLGIDLSYNQLTGSIPPELVNPAGLRVFCLRGNMLSGEIPPGLGNLSQLEYLTLNSNQLTGNIPPELGNLFLLTLLDLGENQLTGSIPPELGKLVHLETLGLGINKLCGGLPSELGNLSNLSFLSLSFNQLTGEIPSRLISLSGLYYLGLDYNGLYTEDPVLINFLNTKSPHWDESQTMAPGGITATPVAPGTIRIDWTPIAFISGTGGYRVSSTTTPGGPYTFHGETANKSVSSMEVTGLSSGETCFFVIATRTDPFFYQLNTVTSEVSPEVMVEVPADHYVIAGNVTGGGASLAGVLLYTDGGISGIYSTDSAGNYQVVVPGFWTGTITPERDGCSFSPLHMEYTNVLFNHFNQDYSATSSVPGSLTVISPNGTEEWDIGSVRVITWSGEGIVGNVRIEYSTDHMATWTDVAASTANDGSFEWTVPSTLSSQCRVRISDLSNAATVDSSDADFAIIAVSGSRFVNDGVWQNATEGLDGWYVGDFTGDGTDDIMNVTLRHQKVFESDGTRFIKLGSWIKALTGLYGWFPGDFNGDGKTDLLRYCEVDRTQVFLSTGSAFVKDFIWASVNPGSDGYTIGDFNGDQADDMLIFNGATNHSYVYLSSGTKFESPVSWFKGHSGDDGWYAGDFNGDGLTDIARVNLALGTQVLLSNGTGFIKNGVWTAALPPANGWFVSDYNGDGKDDLLRCLDDLSGAEVFLSTGSGFNYDGCWSDAALLGADWRAGDYTGDNRTDLLRYNTVNQESEVFVSTAAAPGASTATRYTLSEDDLNKGIDLSRPELTPDAEAELIRPWLDKLRHGEEGNYFLQIKKTVEEKLGRKVRDTVIHRMLYRHHKKR